MYQIQVINVLTELLIDPFRLTLTKNSPQYYQKCNHRGLSKQRQDYVYKTKDR